jgi:5-methylthioribose kinase
MENSSIDYKKKEEFIEELLTTDRNDWDNYREEFVKILVKYGYRDYLYEEEKNWYKDNIEEGEYCQSVSNYVF